MYELQLWQWFGTFPPKMLLVLKLEDMSTEGGIQLTMDKVRQYLDLLPFDIIDNSVKNSRSYTDSLSDDMKDVLDFFKSI